MPEFKQLVVKLESITQREPSTKLELDRKFKEIDKNGNGKLTMDGLFIIYGQDCQQILFKLIIFYNLEVVKAVS